MTPSDLERRLADLERRLPQGVGVSTNYGRSEVRPTQVGFPVTLTSAFDSATGYSWSQNVVDLSLPGIDAPPRPRTGNNAFTPDNNRSLQPGQCGWLELDPQAQGWVFILSGSCTTTTTTTTTISPNSACAGLCYWNYANNCWTIQSKSCDSPCGNGCNCLAPNFCPSGNASTITNCAQLSQDQTNVCCGCTTQTSSSPCPSGKCKYTCRLFGSQDGEYPISQYWQLNDDSDCTTACCPYLGTCADYACLATTSADCGSSAGAKISGKAAPGGGIMTLGGNVSVPVGGGGKPGCACSGTCIWNWVTDDGINGVDVGWGWALNTNYPNCAANSTQCGQAPNACGCDPPSYPGTFCHEGACTPCYGSTSAAAACCGQNCSTPGCVGNCNWVSYDGSTWSLLGGCVGCSCYPPTYSPVAIDQQATTSCQLPVTTTTTTASPTTTTTTHAPCYSTNCIWQCVNGAWVNTSYCSGMGCDCPFPNGARPCSCGNCGPDCVSPPPPCFEVTPCGKSGTTTPAPYTTTTASPGTTTTSTTPMPCWCCCGSYYDRALPCECYNKCGVGGSLTCAQYCSMYVSEWTGYAVGPSSSQSACLVTCGSGDGICTTSGPATTTSTNSPTTTTTTTSVVPIPPSPPGPPVVPPP